MIEQLIKKIIRLVIYVLAISFCTIILVDVIRNFQNYIILISFLTVAGLFLLGLWAFED